MVFFNFCAGLELYGGFWRLFVVSREWLPFFLLQANLGIWFENLRV